MVVEASLDSYSAYNHRFWGLWLSSLACSFGTNDGLGGSNLSLHKYRILQPYQTIHEDESRHIHTLRNHSHRIRSMDTLRYERDWSLPDYSPGSPSLLYCSIHYPIRYRSIHRRLDRQKKKLSPPIKPLRIAGE